MRTICVDFDGVIHSYVSGWKGAEVIPDPPVPGAIGFLTLLISRGYNVAILTTRAQDADSIWQIRRWLGEHGFTAANSIIITDKKLPAEVYIDDRALRFTGVWPGMEEIEAAARPWNKPDRKPAN